MATDSRPNLVITYSRPNLVMFCRSKRVLCFAIFWRHRNSAYKSHVSLYQYRAQCSFEQWSMCSEWNDHITFLITFVMFVWISSFAEIGIYCVDARFHLTSLLGWNLAITRKSQNFICQRSQNFPFSCHIPPYVIRMELTQISTSCIRPVWKASLSVCNVEVWD